MKNFVYLQSQITIHTDSTLSAMPSVTGIFNAQRTAYIPATRYPRGMVVMASRPCVKDLTARKGTSLLLCPMSNIYTL